MLCIYVFVILVLKEPLLYSVPTFGLLLNAVASDDIIPGKRRIIDDPHSLRKKVFGRYGLYVDILHRSCFEMILCGLGLINTAGQTKELF